MKTQRVPAPVPAETISLTGLTQKQVDIIGYLLFNAWRTGGILYAKADYADLYNDLLPVRSPNKCNQRLGT